MDCGFVFTQSLISLSLSLSPPPIAIATVYVVVNVLFSGFLIPRTQIPPYFIWLHYISPMKVAVNGWCRADREKGKEKNLGDRDDEWHLGEHTF